MPGRNVKKRKIEKSVKQKICLKNMEKVLGRRYAKNKISKKLQAKDFFFKSGKNRKYVAQQKIF